MTASKLLKLTNKSINKTRYSWHNNTTLLHCIVRIMSSKILLLFTLALLALLYGSNCQQQIKFAQNVTYNPSNGAQNFVVDQTDGRFVQLRINLAGTRPSSFMIVPLTQNPFSASLPSNNKVLGLFKVEFTGDRLDLDPFTGVVFHKYLASDLVNGTNSVTAILYEPSPRRWFRRGTPSTSPSNIPNAIFSRSYLDNQNAVYFGFIEDQGVLPRASTASSIVSTWKAIASFSALAGICLALLL